MATKPRAMLQPEVIGDVDEGYTPEAAEVDELGLTAEERAAFDQMKDGPQDADGAAEPEVAPADGQATEAQPDPAQAQPQEPPAEPDEDDGPDAITTDPKTGKPQKTINFGKHQRLMTKAQKEAADLRAAAEQERINNAKLAERLAILNEALMVPAPTQQTEDQAPTNPWLEPTVDPNENAIEALAQMQRRQEWSQNATTQAQQQTTEMLEDQQLVGGFERDIQRFAATEQGAHFMGTDGAYQFLKNSRLVELGISLFDKDPLDPSEQFTQAEINKIIADYNAEEKWVVSNALKAGKSPAQAILRLAKGRGWKAPTAAPAADPAILQQRQQAAPAARQAAPARAPAQAAGAVAKLQGEIEGARASRSLSDGGGAPPAEPLTAERLLAMDDAEFAAYVDRLPKQQLDAIMGRQLPGRQ